MNKEISFSKYKELGQDYHYQQISQKNFLKFNAYVYARYQLAIELVKRIMNKIKRNDLKILDVGCGDGCFLFLLNKTLKMNGIETFGIDNSNLALQTAVSKNPNSSIKASDVYSLPFEENYFDIIVSSDVIEHISEPSKMLSEIKRVGKNNSNIIIGTPIKYTEKPLDKNHYQEFFPNEYEKLLKEYFSEIKIIQSHSLTYLLMYNKFTSILKYNFLIYRTLINFFSIYLKKNPFFKIKNPNSGNIQFSYMFGIGTIKK